jgi:hypothetical protein
MKKANIHTSAAQTSTERNSDTPGRMTMVTWPTSGE